MIFFLAICKLQQNEKWSQMKIVFFNVFSLFAIVLLLKLFLHGSGYYCFALSFYLVEDFFASSL